MQPLSRSLRCAYAEVLGDLEIATATPHQIEGKLREAGLEGSTLDKAMRFFIAAMKDAKISHSPHLGRRKK